MKMSRGIINYTFFNPKNRNSNIFLKTEIVRKYDIPVFTLFFQFFSIT